MVKPIDGSFWGPSPNADKPKDASTAPAVAPVRLAAINGKRLGSISLKIISKSSGVFNSDYIFCSEIESGSYQIQFEHLDEKSIIHTLEISEKCGHVESEIFKKSETAIPDWIKNNAGWWAEGQIDDNSFVKGIEYLVKVGIIKVT